jgi:hypothetical protein
MPALTVPLNLEPKETQALWSIAAHHARLVAGCAHLTAPLEAHRGNWRTPPSGGHLRQCERVGIHFVRLVHRQWCRHLLIHDNRFHFSGASSDVPAPTDRLGKRLRGDELFSLRRALERDHLLEHGSRIRAGASAGRHIRDDLRQPCPLLQHDQSFPGRKFEGALRPFPALLVMDLKTPTCDQRPTTENSSGRSLGGATPSPLRNLTRRSGSLVESPWWGGEN